MKIRIEESGGKRKYWVNDVAYDRVEDIPAEHQEHFRDDNNNGMPDQFDNLMESVMKMQNKGNVLDGLWGALKTSKGKNAVSNVSNTFSSPGSEGASIWPTIIKIGIAVGVALLAAWVYPIYKEWKASSRTNFQDVQLLADGIATSSGEFTPVQKWATINLLTTN